MSDTENSSSSEEVEDSSAEEESSSEDESITSDEIDATISVIAAQLRMLKGMTGDCSERRLNKIGIKLGDALELIVAAVSLR